MLTILPLHYMHTLSISLTEHISHGWVLGLQISYSVYVPKITKIDWE